MHSGKLLFGLILLVAASCGQGKVIYEKSDSKTKTDNNVTEEVQEPPHPFDRLYEKYNLEKHPPSEYYYKVTDDEYRAFEMPADSVLIAWSAGSRIGSRSELRGFWKYWEDINQCKNLAIFDNKASGSSTAYPVPYELDFTNFPQLRYFRSKTTTSERHLNQVLATAKKLKGLETYIDVDLPVEICNCDSLEFLDLMTNKPIDLPDCLKDLENLKYIRLSGINDAVVWEIPSLVALDLSLGPEAKIPDSLQNLKHLKHLSIKGGSRDMFPESFDALDSLELLEIGWIDDTISIADKLDGLESLKGVRMVRLSLEEFPRFRSSNQLKLIDGSVINYLENSTIDISACSDSLEALVMNGLAFVNNTSFPVGIGSARQLVYLHLVNFPVDHIPQEVTQLKKLKSLMLHGNNLTYEDLLIVYDTMHKQGLVYFNPPFIGGLSEKDRSVLNQLDREARGALSSYSDPPWITYTNAFDYYRKYLKHGIVTPWSNEIRYD